MRRRDFIAAFGGAAAAWPLAARAQPADAVRRLGVLQAIAESDPVSQARMAVLRDGLRRLGWVDGRNLRIDTRMDASGEPDRLRAQAAELVALKPDVLLAAATPALVALRETTRTLPIVFAQVTDPVGAGYVASLARPGGNITGFAQYEYGLAVKWLELLKQVAPNVIRAAVVHNPAQPTAAGYLASIESGARSIGIRLDSLSVRNAEEIERAITAFAPGTNGGLIVLPSPLTVTHRGMIVNLAARHRLPAVYPWRYFVTSGGLASYGVDLLDLYRRAAGYVDRILKGEKPADLPVQQATKFELVINLKAAKALGLDPPMTLLARTDEVIE